MSHIEVPYENLRMVNDLYFPNAKDVFAKVLDSGYYILGPNVEKFEANFSKYVGTKHCIGVSNGLDALILTLRALDLPIGATVAVQSNTYIATILAVVQAGYKVKLIEPDLQTYNLNEQIVAEKLSSAYFDCLLVTHLYGKPTDLAGILEVCRSRNVKVIEDCAQAHGSKYNGIHVGSRSDAGCFSFYPTKNLGALGDAGGVTTNDDDIALKLRSLRNYGSAKKYYNTDIGYNARLDELQAAFLTEKLETLDEYIKRKREIANIYNNGINNSILTKPFFSPDLFDTYHIYPIRTIKRDELKLFLYENGIGSEIHYPVSPHQQYAYKHMFTGSFPISEEIHRSILSLPISPILSDVQIQKVVEVVNNFR